MMRALMVLLAITLSPKKSTEPTVMMQARRHQLINPLKKSVMLTLDCGAEWEPLLVCVGAKETRYETILQPDGSTAYCLLTNYRTITTTCTDLK